MDDAIRRQLELRRHDVETDRPPRLEDLGTHKVGATWRDYTTGDVYIYTDGLPPAWLHLGRLED